jgi:hypothetical protein
VNAEAIRHALWLSLWLHLARHDTDYLTGQFGWYSPIRGILPTTPRAWN